MLGETDINKLLKNATPIHHKGDFVFCLVTNFNTIPIEDVQSRVQLISATLTFEL
jgi:hypothetical protein